MVKISKLMAAAGVLSVVGLTAMPIASAFAADTVTVNVSVQETITVDTVTDAGQPVSGAGTNYTATYATAGNVDDSSLTYGSGLSGATWTNPAKAVVQSNAPYVLKVSSNDATKVNLVDSDTGNSIPTMATISAGTAGYAIDYSTTANGTTLSGTGKAITASGAAATIATSSTASSASGDAYKYGFKSAIAANTAAGSYNNTIIFTVTKNAAI
ncbi:MAG: hypothetical protein LBM09_01915 [Candidatus Nomurabacteria bacterium]|jgi:hypothetical protein|nr:hypothetical protein [Candidatus Nomurabacteria bacterium]